MIRLVRMEPCIPHCVIIGKDGKIRQKVAASPEKMEELKKQLEEAIK